MRRLLTALAILSLSLLGGTPMTQAQDYWEVWVVDQADAVNGGDRLYIYAPPSWDRPIDVVQLGRAAEGVGDGPGTRPHLLLFNRTHTHGVLANVASGHVYIIRASDRSVVASIDVGVQAHGAMPSPDDRWILVANQNGKRLARIAADFENERFAWQPEADLDLAALEDEDHPDNAPICPVMYVGSAGKAYVTVRGGGLYIVDTLATPMQVVRSYGRNEVAPAGCGGLVAGGRVFVNSGTETSGDLYVFDLETDDLIAHIPTTHLGTDAHGMVLVRNRYLWMANRGLGDNIVIFDVRDNRHVGTITDVGMAPDLMDISPDGSLVFVTLRGPKPLTGAHPAIGETPGVAIIQVEANGASGRRIGFIPIGSQAPDSDADPHAIGVRWP